MSRSGFVVNWVNTDLVASARVSGGVVQVSKR
jgi:hypothetical protein